MGRAACCNEATAGLRRGPWTPEEDQKLSSYIKRHGHGSWRTLPEKAGLQRCGKSCRLRWINYLRPEIKRGKFTLQEEQTIIQLHALLGNRWAVIALHLPRRTDNEIKNYWNTHLKKRLAKMGIDPVTHRRKGVNPEHSGYGESRNAATLSHMAQWETTRLEAEARLVRESRLRQSHLNPSAFQCHQRPVPLPPLPSTIQDEVSSHCNTLDILKVWQAMRMDSALSGVADHCSVKPTNGIAVLGGSSEPMGLHDAFGTHDVEAFIGRQQSMAPNGTNDMWGTTVTPKIHSTITQELSHGLPSLGCHSSTCKYWNPFDSEDHGCGSLIEDQEKMHWSDLVDISGTLDSLVF